MEITSRKITLIFNLCLGVYLIIFWNDLGSEYNVNTWTNMAIAFGASILTVVGIITSIITNSENEKRSIFEDTQNQIIKILERRKILNRDISLDWIYNESLKKISKIIEERKPLEYKDSFIGFASFFLFLFSIMSVMWELDFKIIFSSFMFGIICLVSYIMYCIFVFFQIDRYSIIPKMDGILKISSVMLNGNNINEKGNEMLESKKDKILLLSEMIKNIEFKLTFEGKLRNGFLKFVIRYDDFTESIILDKITSLLDCAFIDGFNQAIIGGEDTGLLHIDGLLELSSKLILKPESNESLGTFNFPSVGRKEIFTYCSIPENKYVDTITIQLIEDPLYRPNYKRRIVNEIIIRIKRVESKSVITKKGDVIKKIVFEDNFEYPINKSPQNPWEVEDTVGQGRVFVTNKIEGTEHFDKCVKIEHVENSRVVLRRDFGDKEKVIIEYYLRMEEYGPQGAGSPFIIESSDDVGDPYETRTIYMDIWNGVLRIDLKEKQNIICKIDLKVWYSIKININCINHKYNCTVINTNTNLTSSIEGNIANGFSSIRRIRTKVFSDNLIWNTYIAGVKVSEF